MQLDNIALSDCRPYLATVPDNTVDLIVIDPPYNELPKDWDSFSDWGFLKDQFDRVLKNGGQLYIFGKQPMMAEIYNGLKDKFEFRFELIWDKGKGLWTSNYLPMRSHELIWCFKKKGVKNSQIYFDIDAIKTPGHPYIRKNRVTSTVRNNWKPNLTIIKDGRRFPLSVIRHPNISRKANGEGTPHPTQKPLEILKWIIESSSKEGDTVLDCFMGSGTTAVACAQTGRHYIGCEIKEEFFKICQERLAQSSIKNNYN
jgi:site-specific DNA-methyltransferase (adenine-specific)